MSDDIRQHTIITAVEFRISDDFSKVTVIERHNNMPDVKYTFLRQEAAVTGYSVDLKAVLQALGVSLPDYIDPMFDVEHLPEFLGKVLGNERALACLALKTARRYWAGVGGGAAMVEAIDVALREFANDTPISADDLSFDDNQRLRKLENDLVRGVPTMRNIKDL